MRWTVWAIIKSRKSRPEGGFGRWRLTPPRYWGCRLRAGRRSFTPLRGYTSSASCGGTFSCAHPSVYPKGTCFAARTGAPSRGRLFYACGREHLIRRCAPPSPQGEGFGRCAIQHRTPPGGRLEGQREMVWPWPFFRAASSRAAAVEMSCKAIPVESKMVISSPPVRPGAAPEMTPPMSQRVPSKMPFL